MCCSCFIAVSSLFRRCFVDASLRKLFREHFCELITQFKLTAPLSFTQAGHGTSKPIPERNDLRDFQFDVLAALNDFLENESFKPRVVALGHSMGCQSVLMLSMQSLIEKAVLIEPIVMKEFGRPDFLIEPTMKRRRVFPSKAFAVESYAKRGIFANWERKCVEDYVQGGTRPVVGSSGEVELCCDPKFEAKIFTMDASLIFKQLSQCRLQRAVVLFGKNSHHVNKEMMQMVANNLPNSELIEMDGGHNLMCENVNVMVDFFAEFIDAPLVVMSKI